MSLRQVWLSFFVSCIAALVLLASMWFFHQSHAADQLLSWLVLVVPVLLGVVVIAVPAKHEDERSHMRWRYTLGTALILYGGLAWVQQSRATNESLDDREKAIRDTAAQTSAEVSKTVGQQYEAMITDLNMQIEGLKKQLSEQGKDFAAQLKQTDTDLNGSISRVGVPPAKYARIEFHPFSQGSQQGVPTVIADDAGVYTADFIFTNISDTATGGGEIWVAVCDLCDFSDSPGFDRPNGLNEKIRHRLFGQLNPGVSMEKMSVKFTIKNPLSWIELAFTYSCSACGKVAPPQTIRYFIVPSVRGNSAAN